MKIDSSYAILMGMIIGLLWLVYAIATFAKRRKRQIECKMLKSVLQAREKGDEPALAASHQPVPELLPVVKPSPSKPRPKVLIAWVPPVSEEPRRFNQYITWPGAKITTPVAERVPSEKDYVWN